MNAAIYLRVSTDAQDYTMQKSALKHYFKSRGIKITKVYEEKISGANDERPEFAKLCQLTRKDVDFIGVYAIDRLARKMSTIVKTIEEFNAKRICLIAIKENFISLDNDFNVSPTTLITLGLFASMAEMERLNIKERTVGGKRQKIQDGQLSIRFSGCPIGYKNKDNKIVIDEEQAAKVKGIFDWYLDGQGCKAIAAYFGFGVSTIKKMLHDRIYIGEGKTKYVDGVFEVPQIIDNETFDKVQELIKEKTNEGAGRKAIIPSPFSRKLKCCVCGHSLIRNVDNRRETVYWVCSCKKISIREDHITEVIKHCFTRHLNEYKEDNVDAIKAQLKKDKKEFDGLLAQELKLVKELKSEEEKVKLLQTHFTIQQLEKEIKQLDKKRKAIANLQAKLRALNENVAKRKEIVKNKANNIFDLGQLCQEHLTSATIYNVGKKYKYVRINIDDFFHYEAFVDVKKNRYDIMSRTPKAGDGYLLDDWYCYVEGDRAYIKSNNDLFDIESLLNGTLLPFQAMLTK